MCAALGLLALPVPAPAPAHEGDPRYRSEVTALQPPVPGLEVRVVNYDDSLELVNRTGKTVVVQGYDGEPYARLLPDGTVQVNDRSPARFLNSERYGDGAAPAGASPSAAPSWRTLSSDGRLSWHDHRMHWMGRGRPPSVTDAAVRTKVFDYRVPLLVEGRRVAIAGTLWWAGEPGGGMPGWAIAVLAAAAVASVFAVLVARRRH